MAKVDKTSTVKSVRVSKILQKCNCYSVPAFYCYKKKRKKKTSFDGKIFVFKTVLNAHKNFFTVLSASD